MDKEIIEKKLDKLNETIEELRIIRKKVTINKELPLEKNGLLNEDSSWQYKFYLI